MASGEDHVDFGVTTSGGPCQKAELDTIAQTVGSRPRYLLWFEDFGAAPPMQKVAAAAEQGAIPVITWEPWTRPERGSAVMRRLANGALDEYVHDWAAELKNCAHRICLRFAHEFNGDWYPWSPAGGTAATDHVAAWRHVHSIFTDGGAANVDWVWCVDAQIKRRAPISDWYPGDEYVDHLAVDGFNWGHCPGRTHWRQPEEVFGSALSALGDLAAKPLMVTEVACAESGGDKAKWIGDLISYLDAQPKVTAFIWFDHRKERDWRIASTPRSAAAMARGLRRGP